MQLIPAIDIIGAECVRLTKGDFSQKTVYDRDPVAVAQRLERMGFRRLHVVDLDGAREGHLCNEAVLRAITSHTHLKVDFGGGIKTMADASRILSAGAEMVTLGSVAVRDPQTFFSCLDRFGSDHIILGADVRDGRVSINGWQDSSGLPLMPFLDRYVSRGVTHVLCTDISKDGTLQGPAIALYKTILEKYPHLHLIASGGVGSNADVDRLREAGIPAVVFGKALYEGQLDIKKLLAHSSLAKRIIPCLDVKDGETVKGTHFVNLRSAGDPMALGKAYSEAGADELVFLDITATVEGRNTFTEMVSEVARQVNIPFTVGGGIQHIDDVERLLLAGADKVSVNSAALNHPSLIDDITRRFGSQVCVVAIDARQEDDGEWHCYTRGGRQLTDRTLMEWALEAQDRGAGEILFTSMNHDGTKRGFANDALASLSDRLDIPVIASGGAGSMADFLHAFTEGKADAALAASVFHYGEIDIPNLKQYLRAHGVKVRID